MDVNSIFLVSIIKPSSSSSSPSSPPINQSINQSTSTQLRYHQKAVRAVTFHNKYPLFASASDDGKLHIFHSTVYNDLLTNPLIVPVKIIHAHDVIQDLGVLDCCFHPTQPFVFSAGADRVIRLFTT